MILPALMQTIEITAPGGPEKLQPCQRPLPHPGTEDVLIKIMAAGVNRPDILQRRGLYPPPPGVSDIPGLEVAGEVVARGSGVKTLQEGDLVCSLLTGGGYAEYCSSPAALCLPVPASCSTIEAAGLPESTFTVWANMVEAGRLQAGERVLIHGGSSGIGVTAIQLARIMGATVFTTAGSEEKCRFCESLGAIAINYRKQDFGDVLRSLTQGQGVHLILDMVGAPYLASNLKALAPQGRLVIIAVQGGSRTEVDLTRIFLKRLTLTGSTLRSRSVDEKIRLTNEVREHVWPLLETRQIRPIVDSLFPLHDAAGAHRRMESSQHMGKIILTTTPHREAHQAVTATS